jgi:GTPase SAR1 family protein
MEDWLKEELDDFPDDDYILFDCPGQIELYSHVPVFRSFVDALRLWDFKCVPLNMFKYIVSGIGLRVMVRTVHIFCVTYVYLRA